MKIEEILLENNENPIYHQTTDVEDFLENYIDDYRLAFKKPTTLFRGFRLGKKSMSQIHLINPTMSRRYSTSGYNLYSVLLDNIPSWNKLPKRSNSVICTNSKIVSRSFGEPYYVFPKGNPILVSCPTSDLWTSFEPLCRIMNLPHSLAHLTRSIMNTFRDQASIKFNDPDDINDLKKEFANFDKRIRSPTIDIPDGIKITPDKLCRYLLEHNLSLFDFFDKLMDPALNKFTMSNLSNFDHPPTSADREDSREIWFSAPAIAIHESLYQQIAPKIIEHLS